MFLNVFWEQMDKEKTIIADGFSSLASLKDERCSLLESII